MFHKNDLGKFGNKLPCDIDSYVPEISLDGDVDDWRDMSYDLGPNDPEEPGITEDERLVRLEYLDNEWWPNEIKKAVEMTKQAEIELDEWRIEFLK